MGALSLRDLTFRYPGANDAALQGLTLDIPRGGVFGLLGPNGAGKTTLISLIAGQLRGASGDMLLDGAPLAEARRRAPRSLGLVPQEHAFYPMLTCRENLRFFGGVQGLGAARLAERVAAASAFARLEPVLERRAGELSGGLKRRLNFAIGLLTEPQVLLLDEPTVGVDAQSRAFLLERIRALAAPDRIVVYTSHYMEEVQAICDRVAIIDHGRVLLAGPLAEVLQDSARSLALRLSAPLPASTCAKTARCATSCASARPPISCKRCRRRKPPGASPCRSRTASAISSSSSCGSPTAACATDAAHPHRAVDQGVACALARCAWARRAFPHARGVHRCASVINNLALVGQVGWFVTKTGML